MGFCKAVDGSIMKDVTIRNIVKECSFEEAYFVVCKYITKRVLQPLHLRIMRNKSRNKMTLDLAPRGFGKSTVGDVDFCITKILRDPNIRIMIGSKTQGQAEAFLKEIRAHFEANEDLIRVFGDLKGIRWTDKEFIVRNRTVIKKEATVTALGASGAVVSKHFDIIIGDDLVGFENARTETQRTKLKEWFYSSLAPTLEPHGEMHILGTRYSPLDLYNDMMKSGNYIVQIQRAITKDSKGAECSLWESKFDFNTLQKIRRESGNIIFSMQYQNDTELAKGNIFKAQYFTYYDEWKYVDNGKGIQVKVCNAEGEARWEKVKVYMGVDLAISEKTTADYFVIAVIGVDRDNNIYLLDYLKERLTFDAQFNRILTYGYDKYPMVERIGVEAVAYQLSLVQELRRNSTLPVMDLHTVKDKVSRAQKRSALFENHKVYFREGMNDMEECLLLFPEVEHDDLFDALDFAITVSESANNVRVLDRKNFRI